MKPTDWIKDASAAQAPAPMDTRPAPAAGYDPVRQLRMAKGILQEIEPLGDAARDLRLFCQTWIGHIEDGTGEPWIEAKRAELGRLIESLGVLYAKVYTGRELRDVAQEEVTEFFMARKRAAMF